MAQVGVFQFPTFTNLTPRAAEITSKPSLGKGWVTTVFDTENGIKDLVYNVFSSNLP